MTETSLALVPPRRLGALLTDARISQVRSIEQVARESRFDHQALVAIEAGQMLLHQHELEELLEAYHVTPEQLLPGRGAVTVDLEEGALVVAGEVADLGAAAPTPDEVLAAYLSLVYTLRQAPPGTRLVLRSRDVAVLAAALRLAEPEVEARLVGLMEEPSPGVGHLARLLHSKLMVPVAGVVVAATALGAVLVIRADGTDTGRAPGSNRPAAVETSVPDATVIAPATQGRNLDGSPSSVSIGD